MALPTERHYLRHLLAPLRDRGFRPWLTFSFCWTFAMTLGGSLSLVFFTENLGGGRFRRRGAPPHTASPRPGREQRSTGPDVWRPSRRCAPRGCR